MEEQRPLLEEYRKKLVASEDATKVICSEDRVVIAANPEPMKLPLALAARHKELRNVEILTQGWNQDIPWFHPGLEESFILYAGIRTVGPKFTKTYDYFMDVLPLRFKPSDEGRAGSRGIDVFIVCVSPPDNNG